MAKKKRTQYEIKITVKPPTDVGQADLHMSGPTSHPEIGRTLWLLCATMGGIIPPVDLTNELNALRHAIENSIPPDHLAEIGRIEETEP